MNNDTHRNIDKRAHETDRATVREWARKTHLREHMREDALPIRELQLLDDRIARWTADRQLEGRLPPDAELHAQRPALENELRSGHEEARPILTTDEIVDVDASRGAAAMRDYIGEHRDFAPGLSRIAVQYAVSAGLSELDARKQIAERFDKLFGNAITDYAQQHNRRPDTEVRPAHANRLFPPELGWDRYEPACRRLAMHDAKFHVDRRDGEITEKQFHEARKQRDAWAAEQRRQGKLPGQNEIGEASTPVNEMLLPFQKQFGRQERNRMQGEHGAYWRRVDQITQHLKEDIESERRYARNLEDYAINHAGSYDRRADKMMRDIEMRFTLINLYTPSEYLEKQMDLHKEPQPDLSADRTENEMAVPTHDHNSNGRNR